MKVKSLQIYLTGFLILLVAAASCDTTSNKPKEVPLTVYEDSLLGRSKAKKAREGIVVKLTDGLELNLWASDSLAPDPIAMSGKSGLQCLKRS